MAEPLLIAKHASIECHLLPGLANRHGLITGATGTGKTVTLQTLAENFSRIGVPVFMADVKGDLTGMSQTGHIPEKMAAVLKDRGLEQPTTQACPVTLWDVFGEQGHPVRATVSDMGPLLLSRMLGLNERVTSVDVPLGPDSDRSLLDTIADQQVSDPAELLQEEDNLKKAQARYKAFYHTDRKKRTINYAALIHRLVAEYFIPRTSEDQLFVSHIDHDKLNNKVNNLKWMTAEEKNAHQAKSPLVIEEKKKRKQAGYEAIKSKLTVTKVMYLKKLLNEGVPVRNLAKQFKVTETQIIRIKKNENWASVEAAK